MPAHFYKILYSDDILAKKKTGSQCAPHRPIGFKVLLVISLIVEIITCLALLRKVWQFFIFLNKYKELISK